MFIIKFKADLSTPNMSHKLIKVLKYDFEVSLFNGCKPVGTYTVVLNINMFSKLLVICNAHNKVNAILTDRHIFDIIQDGMHPANTLYILNIPTYLNLRNPNSVCKSILVLITSAKQGR